MGGGEERWEGERQKKARKGYLHLIILKKEEY